jgi:hypothetical protein
VDPTAPACASEGGWTGIEYQVTGGLATDVVSTLVTANNAVLPNQVYLPTGFSLKPDCTAANGGGDLTTDIGEYSCHERALRVKVNTDGTFWVIVKGRKEAIPTSIAQKRGSCPTKSTAILGLGLDAAPVAPVTETLRHEQCAVEFSSDRITGAFLSAKLTADSDPDCQFFVDDVQNLRLVLNGTDIGSANYGEGYTNTGAGSCTTRVIGGKVYTWGKPCP